MLNMRLQGHHGICRGRSALRRGTVHLRPWLTKNFRLPDPDGPLVISWRAVSAVLDSWGASHWWAWAQGKLRNLGQLRAVRILPELELG